MILEVKFKECHLKQLKLQDSQKYVEDCLTPIFISAIDETCEIGRTWYWKEDIIGCGFLFWNWNNQDDWMFWGFFSPLRGPMLLGLRRIFMNFINERNIFHSIYTPMVPGFKEGYRFAKMLGFEDSGTYVEPETGKKMEMMRLDF